MIHIKHQHFGLYIIKETPHFLKYSNSQYIEACLYVGIGTQFRKEKKITLELLNFFKITEQEKQHWTSILIVCSFYTEPWFKSKSKDSPPLFLVNNCVVNLDDFSSGFYPGVAFLIFYWKEGSFGIFILMSPMLIFLGISGRFIFFTADTAQAGAPAKQASDFSQCVF